MTQEQLYIKFDDYKAIFCEMVCRDKPCYNGNCWAVEFFDKIQKKMEGN